MKKYVSLGSLVLLAAVTGCGAGSDSTKATGKGSEKAQPTKAEPTPANVFQRPSPAEAAHDPRVITLKATTDRITGALTRVRDRLTDMRIALETKGSSETDLLRVASDLKTLTGQAREDCDAITRAAVDLRAELPLAQKGYTVTAELYRERAESLKDPDLKSVTLRMADEFDRLAAVTPERVELTDTFITQLTEVKEFLAQADRCLGDTKTALEILTAGPSPVHVSAEAKAFRRHLEQFLAIIVEYQRKLLAPPPPASPRPTPAPPPQPETKSGTSWDLVSSPAPECPPPLPPPNVDVLTDPEVPGKDILLPYRCPHCGGYHVGQYRVAATPEFTGLEPYTGTAKVKSYVPQAGGK